MKTEFNADWVTDIMDDVIGSTPPKPVQNDIEELIPPEKEETLEELTKNWSMKKADADKTREERIWSILGKDETKPFTKIEDIVSYVLNGTISGPYAELCMELFFDMEHEEASKLSWDLDNHKEKFPMISQKHGVDVFFSKLEFWKRVIDTAKKSKKLKKQKSSRDELIELANKKIHDSYCAITYSDAQREKAELHSKEKAVRSRL